MKHLLHIFVSLILVSVIICCNSESAQIKRSLKSSIPIESVKLYKYKSHQIIETLLKNNVEDSISTYEQVNNVIEMSIDYKKQICNYYQSNLDDCIRKQKDTFYWMRDSYDALIKDWQRMIDGVNEKIAEDSLKIKSNNNRIALYRQYLDNTATPIVFYVVKHNYLLDGTSCLEYITLDANYKLINY